MMLATEAVGPKKKLKIKCGISRTEASAACMFRKQMDMSLCGNKRGRETEFNGQNAKRQRMDRSMTLRCSTVLGQLMKHPAGWIFSRPVDPVALNIPDYFNIISKPMDLGTVKDKLHKDMYSGPEKFAADVRLTFSNAILYNPPFNSVHNYAKELSNIFESKWKIVGGKGYHKSSGATQEQNLTDKKLGICDTRKSIPKRSPPHSSFASKSLMASEKCKKTLNAGIKKVEHPKVPQTCIKHSRENSLKGTGVGGNHGCGSENAKQRWRPIASKCSGCLSSACRCRRPHNSNFTSSSYISSDKSVGQEHNYSCDKASKQNCHLQSTSAAKFSKSDQDSDGASTSGDERMCFSNYQVLSVTTDGGLTKEYTPICEIQLSPSKALRIAKLKSRFADTILKAQQKTQMENGDREDPVKMQQEKERLKRLQHEEKARIEAQIEASKAAARRKETELKTQRQREREAARLAHENMEKTVAIEDNMKFLKELEKLSGCRSVFPTVHSWNPLENLGLRLKDDNYLSDEDDLG